jgi:hypothetical protein
VWPPSGEPTHMGTSPTTSLDYFQTKETWASWIQMGCDLFHPEEVLQQIFLSHICSTWSLQVGSTSPCRAILWGHPSIPRHFQPMMFDSKGQMRSILCVCSNIIKLDQCFSFLSILGCSQIWLESRFESKIFKKPFILSVT